MVEDMMRSSGILLPVASLGSRYGIGAFSKEAYDFVDRLKEAGQRYWQILPLGATGYGDSPYQSFSTFAGNPYFIDLDELVRRGLLSRGECEAYDFGVDKCCVDYEKIYRSRFDILRKAFVRSGIGEDKGFVSFCEDNDYWLRDYALYMAVKQLFDGKSWVEWEDGIRRRSVEVVAEYEDKLSEEILFYKFLEFEFISQWERLKGYANERGIEIIGDIPIYVALDSADTWANPELFQLDEEKLPLEVAGCPPDGFAATGQLWGNPLYRWDDERDHVFGWWAKRIGYCYKLYDVIRIDHFRGFDEYYAIPYGDATAENGRWRKGPGLEFFQNLRERLGDLSIIAEDLGFLTDSVRKLVDDTGYPGMKVLQFAFDSREESDYLPHNYERNCIVYTGTHDNDTVKGWYASIPKEDREKVIQYMNIEGHSEDEIHWDFIRLAKASVADVCIIPFQDYLGLGTEARINVPSTLGGNWVWRMRRDDFTHALAKKIRGLTELYGRYCL